jgi:hypothetical protein
MVDGNLKLSIVFNLFVILYIFMIILLKGIYFFYYPRFRREIYPDDCVLDFIKPCTLHNIIVL